MYLTGAVIFAVLLGTEALSKYSTSMCTCAAGSVPFDIYDKTDNTGNFETKCVAGSFSLEGTSEPSGATTGKSCYATCTGNPCTAPTVTCTNTNTFTSGKPGKCPENDIQTIATYVDECTVDTGCTGQKKCCLQQPSGKRKCINPVAPGKTKCGKCKEFGLFDRTISPWFYDRACTSEDMCTDAAKCCAYAAGQSKCFSSVSPFTLS